MDVNRVRPGQRLAAIGGVVLLVDLWLSWYGIDLGGIAKGLVGGAGIDTTVSAWQAFSWIDIILFVTAVGAIAIAAIPAVGRAVELPFPLATVVAGLAGLSVLLIFYRIVNQPGPNDLISVKYGAWLGLIAAIVTTVGALRAMGEPVEAAEVPPAAPSPPAAPLV